MLDQTIEKLEAISRDTPDMPIAVEWIGIDGKPKLETIGGIRQDRSSNSVLIQTSNLHEPYTTVNCLLQALIKRKAGNSDLLVQITSNNNEILRIKNLNFKSELWLLIQV